MSRKYQDAYAIKRETGEVMDLVIDKEVSSQNFWKIWLSDILTIMDIISNSKQLDVVLQIIQHIKQSDIAKKTGISEKTVATAFRTLLKNNFLRKIHSGVYQVNTKYIVKGNENKRRMIINYYNTLNLYAKDDRNPEQNEN